MLESRLPENLDRRAHKAALRVAELNTALEFARKAANCLVHRPNQLCAPDPGTVQMLSIAVRLLRVELEDARRLEQSAARIADESHGLRPEAV
jgi:hypothetical protein